MFKIIMLTYLSLVIEIIVFPVPGFAFLSGKIIQKRSLGIQGNTGD